MPIVSNKLFVIILSLAVLIVLTFTLIGLWHVESLDVLAP